MIAEVIPISIPNLTDIPAMLRCVADQIEVGDWGKVETAFLVIPREGDFPRLFGWGAIEGSNDPLIQLELTRHWLLTNLVSR